MLTAAQVHSMIQTTVATVKKDVRQMVRTFTLLKVGGVLLPFPPAGGGGEDGEREGGAGCVSVQTGYCSGNEISLPQLPPHDGQQLLRYAHHMKEEMCVTSYRCLGPPVATEPKASVEHGTDTGRKATQAAVVGTNRNKRAAGSARGGRGGKRVAGATQGQRSRK